MQAQKEAPPDMQCKEKFLLQSVAASPGASAKDITLEMFIKQSGRVVEECKLRVIYLPPPQLPSPILENPDEGISPKVSFADGGKASFTDGGKASFTDSLKASFTDGLKVFFTDSVFKTICGFA